MSDPAEVRLERRHSGDWLCLDCGCVVGDPTPHRRFHSILSGHAWALAVLKTAHLAGHIHDRYEVVEKIDSRKFDNWSADALAEISESTTAPDKEQE